MSFFVFGKQPQIKATLMFFFKLQKHIRSHKVHEKYNLNFNYPVLHIHTDQPTSKPLTDEVYNTDDFITLSPVMGWDILNSK